MARSVAETYFAGREELGFPMCKADSKAEVANG